MKLIFYLLSRLYSGISAIRNYCYDRNIIKIHKIEKPVISIGNITTGGTGKTPMTRYLAEKLIQLGYKPGIISRGYGRFSNSQVVVHNGEKICCNWNECGDEPFLLGNWLKTVPIIVDADRVSAAKTMIEQFDIDVILLDDAFQHRRIHRDLDIVLINSSTSNNSLDLLPAGQLRENLLNINRSDVVIFTKSNSNTQFNPVTLPIKIDSMILNSTAQYILTKHPNDDPITPDSVKQPIFGFCGIGDPESFHDGLNSIGVNSDHFQFFKDHHNYDSGELRSLLTKIKSDNINSVITTEKDAVKLPDWFINDVNLFILQTAVVFSHRFEGILLERVKKVLV